MRALLAVWMACAPDAEKISPPAVPTDTRPSSPASDTSPQTSTEETTETAGTTDTASTDTTTTTWQTDLGTTSTTIGVPDYSQPGPYIVDRASGSFTASCAMDYDTYTPQGHTPAAWVVLAHGFLRDRGPMEGIAVHLASWGLSVVAPDLCHLDLVDLDYDENADDLVALSAFISGGGPVLQAGHSAGALSSFLAASLDPLAVGHLGLDLVEFEGAGDAVAAAMPVPSWGVFGEPEICNLSNNSLDVYDDVPDHRLVRVIGADHCDFESPTDIGCTLVCASGSGSTVDVQAAIWGMAAAAALALTGEDPRGVEFWTPGQPGYDALIASGILEEP